MILHHHYYYYYHRFVKNISIEYFCSRLHSSAVWSKKTFNKGLRECMFGISSLRNSEYSLSSNIHVDHKTYYGYSTPFIPSGDRHEAIAQYRSDIVLSYGFSNSDRIALMICTGASCSMLICLSATICQQ